MLKLFLPDQLKLVPYPFSCPAAGLLYLCTCAGFSIGLLGADPWDSSPAPHLSGLCSLCLPPYLGSGITEGDQCKVLLDGQCHV